jgi:anaerobic ribonucleoside-triphosphate reductase activating protein
VGLWLAGCRRRCPGCLSPDFFDVKPEQKIDPLELAGQILFLAKKMGLKALTVSGGEPFERAENLGILLEKLRGEGIRDVLAYTGFEAAGLLAEFPWVPELVSALVDGPFDLNEPSQEIFRGSRGQKLFIFDPSLDPMYSGWSKQTKRQAQFLLERGRIRILGVPAIGDYEKAFAAADEANDLSV